MPTDAHFLTFSVLHRKALLSDPFVAQLFLANLDRVRNMLQFELWAYVVMPEHVHLVVWPSNPDYRMELILSEIKKPVSREVFQQWPELREQCRVRHSREEFNFWQPGGGYDRNLRTSADVWEKINYVHDNPVRRSLTEDPMKYPFTSLPAYHDLPTPIPVDLCRSGS